MKTFYVRGAVDDGQNHLAFIRRAIGVVHNNIITIIDGLAVHFCLVHRKSIGAHGEKARVALAFNNRVRNAKIAHDILVRQHFRRTAVRNADDGDLQ